MINYCEQLQVLTWSFDKCVRCAMIKSGNLHIYHLIDLSFSNFEICNTLLLFTVLMLGNRSLTIISPNWKLYPLHSVFLGSRSHHSISTGFYVVFVFLCLVYCTYSRRISSHLWISVYLVRGTVNFIHHSCTLKLQLLQVGL